MTTSERFCTYEGPGPHDCPGTPWEHETDCDMDEDCVCKPTETRTEQLLRLAHEAEVRALTRRSLIDRRDDLEEARLLRASAATHGKGSA